MRWVWRIANTLFLLVFVFGIVVQYNDPDPWRWAMVYALAAAACVLALRGSRSWQLPGLVALGTFVWAMSIAPRVVGHVRVSELFEEFEMKNDLVEEAREMGGLLIIAAWMAGIAVVSGVHRRRAGVDR